MSDNTKLTEFLTELATNEELVKAFKSDKDKTMKSAGISDEHAELIRNGEYEKIEKILGADYNISSNEVIRAFRKD